MRFIKYNNPDVPSVAPSARLGGRFGRTDIENEIDWLFGAALSGIAGSALGGQFPVDLYEDKDNSYVRAELPGVTRDAISVEIVDGSLSIQASRKDKSGRGGEHRVVQPADQHPGRRAGATRSPPPTRTGSSP